MLSPLLLQSDRAGDRGDGGHLVVIQISIIYWKVHLPTAKIFAYASILYYLQKAINRFSHK